MPVDAPASNSTSTEAPPIPSAETSSNPTSEAASKSLKTTSSDNAEAPQVLASKTEAPQTLTETTSSAANTEIPKKPLSRYMLAVTSTLPLPAARLDISSLAVYSAPGFEYMHIDLRSSFRRMFQSLPCQARHCMNVISLLTSKQIMPCTPWPAGVEPRHLPSEASSSVVVTPPPRGCRV